MLKVQGNWVKELGKIGCGVGFRWEDVKNASNEAVNFNPVFTLLQ